MNRNVSSFEPANFVLVEFFISTKVSKLLKKAKNLNTLYIVYN